MLILAYVSEMMTQAFGINWISGGILSIRFKAPARPGDTVTISGVINTVTYENDCTNISCTLTCCNQKDEAIVTGGATVKLHS